MSYRVSVFCRLLVRRCLAFALATLAAAGLLPSRASAAQCIAPPAGLSAFYTGNANSLDAISGLHGLMGTAVSFTNALVGQGFAFRDDPASVLRLPASPLWTPEGNQLSIECWIRPDFSVSGDKLDTILSKRDGCSTISYQFGVYKGHQTAAKIGLLFFSIGNSGLDSTNRIPNDGLFHHVAAVFDGTVTNGTFQLYIDGKPAGTASGNVTIPATSATPVIGQHGGCNYFSSAVMDEISFYGRPLTAGEVQSIYAAGAAGKCIPSIAGAAVPYFTDFESGSGSEWSMRTTDGSEPSRLSRFLGRMSANEALLTLTNLTPGTSYTIHFDFYPIDSWDGGNTTSGDILAVLVDSQTLFRESFANYNGNPPGGSQSFLRSPDEGRGPMGFNTTYYDAIYRSIEIPFVASNTVAVVRFQGVNLQDVSDESWGLDNVLVRPTAATTATVITSTTLPAANSTQSLAVDRFVASSSRPLQVASATNASNWSLRAAGPNGVLGDGDDVAIALTASLIPPFNTARSVQLSLLNGATLQPGRYRFTTGAGLLDTNGSPVTTYARDFTLVNPNPGRLEALGSDSIVTASDLGLVETPSGSGFQTALGVGVFSAAGDVDYWRFDAETGDIVTMRLETQGTGTNPQMQLQNVSGGVLQNVGGGGDGVVGFERYRFATPGTYYVRVWSDQRSAPYRLRLDLARGIQLEAEPNDTTAQATALNLKFGSGLAQARIAGAVLGGSDFFSLLNFSAGNSVSVTARYPDGSTLPPQGLTLTLLAGNEIIASQVGNSLNVPLTKDTNYFLQVFSTNTDIRSQYLLDIAVSDSVAPKVTGTSLPAQGTASGSIIDRFTLTYSEDLNATTATNASNYELRGAGVDGAFNTVDDAVYTLAPDAYTTGLSLGYAIVDGPIQPGLTRLTVKTSVTDRIGNALASPYTVSFTITNPPGYLLETRNNNIPGTATPLLSVGKGNPSGTLAWVYNLGVLGNPEYMAAADLNGDGSIDLAVPYRAGSIGIFTNDGAGQLVLATNIPGLSDAVSIVVGRFNNDSIPDLAVARYNANSVTMVMGTPTGWTVGTTTTGVPGPYQQVGGDFNNDGFTDLAVPNFNGGSMAVLLANGSGGFLTPVTYTVTGNVYQVAAGKLNADASLDLVASSTSGQIAVLLGKADGSFQPPVYYASGPTTRSVTLGDINGDGFLDAVTFAAGDDTLNLLLGKGDGTLQSRVDYPSGVSDAYQVMLGDFTGDGRLDAIISGYGSGNWSLLQNNASGGFRAPMVYPLGNGPTGAAIADFNQDGRTDVVFSRYNAATLSVYYGMPEVSQTEDPALSGVRSMFAHGELTSSSDEDYFRFSAVAGEKVVIAIETPGAPGSSGLRVDLYRFDDVLLNTFYPTANGWGQSAPLQINQTASYTVRVTENYGYRGEYRLRITRAAAGVGIETEDNNAVASANYPGYVQGAGQLSARMVGYLSYGDAAGDHFDLGFLEPGTQVDLGLLEPASSGLQGIIALLNSSGQAQAVSPSGATNLNFTIPPGAGGTYSVRITSDPLPPAQLIGGQAGSSLLFNGVDQFVRVPDSTSLRPVNLTLESWVNFAGFSASDVFIAKGLGGADDNAYAIWYSSGQLHGYISGSTTLNYTWAPEVGRWYHVAYVFDDAANTHLLYVDGVQVASGSVNNSITYDTRPVHLGADSTGDTANHFFAGKLDDVRIWSVARAAGDIAAARFLRLNGNEAGLAAYWRLDEGTGQTTADATVNANNGQLNGLPVWSASGTPGPSTSPLAAQYLLGLTLKDSKPLQVVSTTLPPEGAGLSNLWQSFSVSFNEELSPQINVLNRNIYTRGSSHYFVTDTAMTWADAEAFAVSVGGHLARISSAALNTFLQQTFSAAATGDLWIGLTDQASEGNYAWIGGGTLPFTNWQNGQPDNNGGADGAVLTIANGSWYDDSLLTARRALVEVPVGTDVDGDGIANSADPYPADRLNGFDLRAAGTDGNFDTSDDQIYRLRLTSYSRGTNVSFFIVDGPLQPGSYRFSATASIRDRFGNGLAPAFARKFTLNPLAGFLSENRTNDLPVQATVINGGTANGQALGDFREAFRVPKVGNTHHLVATNLNGDAFIDLIANNYSDDTMSIYLGQADGSFLLQTNLPVGNGPVGFTVADLNKDGKLDLSISLYGAARLAILLGDGTGKFTSLTNYATGSQPYYQTVADLNGDGNQDIAVANYSSGGISLFYGNGNGTFKPKVDIATGSGAISIVAADLKDDGSPNDLVVGNRNAASISVLIANGDGTYQPPVNYPAATTGGAIAVLDFDLDTFLDVVDVTGSKLNFYAGKGDGTFAPATTTDIPSSDVYDVSVADIDGNGTPDLIIPSYGNSRLVTVMNQGNGKFVPWIDYPASGNPISSALYDFNNDGRIDVATGNYNGASISIYYGLGSQPLALDSSTQLRSGAVRGFLPESGDVDYWSFSGNAGDKLTLAVESVGAQASSQLQYYIYQPNGSELSNFVSDNTGRGEYNGTLPTTGTYQIRVQRYDAYAGEYRLRVTLAPNAFQYESENNNTIAAADPVTFALVDGRQTADFFGYIALNDPADFFRLGNLSPGTEISLASTRPATGTVLGIPAVFNSAETLVALGTPGQTNLTYVVPAGQAGAHYARLTASFSTPPNGATNALWFDAGDDSVRVGNWTPGRRWSAQAWVLPTSAPSGRHTVVGSLGACQDWAIVLQDGKPGVAYRPADGSCTATLTAPAIAELGRWLHLAGVSDGTNLFLYVNGVLMGTALVDQAWSPYAGGVWIGGEVCCAANGFGGAISSVAIWNKPLTAQEIAPYLTQNPAGNESGLLGYWPLNDSTGTTAKDLSSQNRPGTLFNGPQWTTLSPVSRGGLGVLAEYRLGIGLRDTAPPFVTDTTLPAAGSSSTALIDRFSVSFSEDMAPASVLSTNAYELRSAGPNGAFDGVDDSVYTVVNSPTYANGISASYLIPDGPLQPGLYRFTARAPLADTSGTPLASNYVQQFTIASVPGYLSESRSNDGVATAVPFGTPAGGILGTFRAGTTVPSGVHPEYSLFADLNGDSQQDLLVINYGANSLSFFQGNGDGTFTLKTNWASSASGPLQPVLTNLNGDAFPDLVIGNYTANSVSVYFGNGNGSFRAYTNYAVGNQPLGVVVADLNNDGRPDIATANYGSSTLSVLLGLGGGNFQPAVSYPVAGVPYQLTVADFNKDGRLDLATASYNTDALMLFLGKGDGTFPAPSTVSTGNNPYAIASGDLDSDGNPDLVTSSSDGTIYAYRGNGNGSFQTALRLPTGIGLNYTLSLADLDQNGRLDILATGFNTDKIAVLLQTGPFVFEPSITYSTGNQPIGIMVADVNNDSRPDIGVVQYGSGDVGVWLGREKQSMVADADGQRVVFGRGVLYNNGDTDFWSFPASAGDQVQIVIENVGDPNASGRCLDIYSPSGVSLEGWCTDYNGRGTFSRVLGNTGIYSVRVRYNYTYAGEYRLRISVVSPPVQVETESNDSPGASQSLVWNETLGQRSATVFGTLHRDDTPGDYFRLGNLSPGVLLQLTRGTPAASTLSHQWSIYRGNSLVTNSPVNASAFSYAIPPGAGDDYYVRITAQNGSAGLTATYILGITLFDGEGPQVVSTTLPAAGTSTTALLDGFSIEFSEDLNVEVGKLARRPLSYGGHSYLRSTSDTSWLNVNDEVRALGGNLVSIQDGAENAWILNNFGGGIWIGLTDDSQEGTFSWVDGSPLSYTNWNAGEPNNSGNEDYGVMIAGGKWNDEPPTSTHYAVFEFAGPDADNDGLVDAADPYPSDRYNLFDLRGAGDDDVFDTADDVVYTLQAPAYTSGTTMAFSLLNGPVQAGRVRLRVTTSLRDRLGNPAANVYDQIFRVDPTPPFQAETRDNSAPATATPLVLQEGPVNFRTAFARGKLLNSTDADYWSFTGNAGEILTVSVDVPGDPAATGLRYRILGVDGSTLLDQNAEYYGNGSFGPLTLASNGVYRVLVTQNYGYYGEYQFRISMTTPPLVTESEPNETIATATPVSIQVDGTGRFGSIIGTQAAGADLDYYDLGTITNGSSVFLNVRLPKDSSYVPVVALYNASGQYQNEVSGGRSGDGIAEVRVLTTGRYYALVRGGAGSVANLLAQYLLDIQIVPTGTVSFPNLQISGITLPSGTPQSGQTISFGFTVANIGQLATPVNAWVDRAVLSLNDVLGDADDIPLGFFNRVGALTSGGGYGVNGSAPLPEGVSGNYFLIAQADAGNAVNEFIFESDNVTVSSSAFHIDRAPYPDLKVEDLQWSGPTAQGVYTVRWKTANRGDGPAKGGFRDRLTVRNLNSGQLLTSTDIPVAAGFASGAVLQRETTVTTTNAGTYQIVVTTDVLDDAYEFDAISHASAEFNTATTQFIIAQFFSISVNASPAEGGVVTGGGSFASGNPLTVTARPSTNDRPYFFVNWTEAGVFQSASPDYTFTVSRPRSLVANFSLPAYALTGSNNPPVGGSIEGQGTYFHGATAVLSANPNPGYRFINWTEQGAVISLNPKITNTVTASRFLVANYSEANPVHVVTAATSPDNLTPITGSGTYSNGQSTTITAPLRVTNSPTLYTFREFRVNGSPAGSSPTITKTFSTLDPANIQYLAYYDSNSLLPVVVKASGGFTNQGGVGFTTVTNPVPATTQYQITLQFDRSMSLLPNPVVTLTNRSGVAQPTVTGPGFWFSTIESNDTYRTAPITFGAGMDGLTTVRVSRAKDPAGLIMAIAEVMALQVDVTPPGQPALSLTSSNSTSATFSWNSYSAPTDLGGFRIYKSAASFSSVAGLTPITTLGKNGRSTVFTGLELDTPYHIAVVAFDEAGNTPASVNSTLLTLPRTVPPAVALQVTAKDASTASLSWSGYSTANLLGFQGFWVYYETSAFASVQGLTPKLTLGAASRSVEVPGLDRQKTYYFAVVGYNSANGYLPQVTPQTWSDPFAGKITQNLTLGTSSPSVVEILQPMLITSNATLTVLPGTTVRMSPGAGITVEQGRLLASGTALDPIVFTSSQDVAGQEPNPGDWSGITLGAGATGSTLRHVFIQYGAGLTLSNVSPVLEALTSTRNTPAGLRLLGTASVNTTEALIAYNDIGVQQSGTGVLNIRQSVLKNNPTNALASAGSSLIATQNWWGTAVAADIDSTLRGTVNRSGFLLGEPLLTPALGLSNGVTQVGTRDIQLRLACRTADAMRLSENSAFLAVFYQNFRSPVPFQLSDGGGTKTLYAQFRSVTGDTSAPVALSLTYITAGPNLGTFSLTEGQILTRPITVTASATAALGMAGIDFLVDDQPITTQTGGSFSYRYDVRNNTNGVHRMKLVARDNSGNRATRELNVTINLATPPAPVITTPAADLNGSESTITLRGNAEPLISVRLVQNNSPVANETADASGNWAFENVALNEGNNAFAVSAYDSLGSAASGVRNVVRDTGPPAAPVIDTLYYNTVEGLSLAWSFAPNGERPTFFRVYWHSNSFSVPAQASRQSGLLTAMNHRPAGLTPGTYYFAVVGYDAAGNASPLSNIVPFNYDPIPPSFNVSFSKVSPAGLGLLKVTVVASEALVDVPSLTLLPGGNNPVSLTLSNAALNTFEATLNVTALFPSGPLGLIVSGRDLSGNTFNGPPSGQSMTIDVQPPSGRIVVVPESPVQTTNSPTVTVSLTLSEPAKPGTTPSLGFSPPVGPLVSIPLTGNGSNWVGSFVALPAMGSGSGTFALSTRDALDNLGQRITSGGSLELYNTPLPKPPGQPVNFTANSLGAGKVRLSWTSVSNAELYRLYSQPGTNVLLTPTNLVADNILSNSWIDLPAADGYQLYSVTAVRRGSEGTNSITRAVLSDRTPPPAPTGVAVQLLASGVQITWRPGSGEAASSYIVYRNGQAIRTVGGGTTNITDSPPRGVMSYAVAAADSLGNEALSTPANIELLVGAVQGFTALVRAGDAPVLSWSSTDNTAVGYNVYRNGIKQNATPVTALQFTDTLGIPAGGLIQYMVRAVNSTNAESAPRFVDVHDVGLDFFANLVGTQEQSLVTDYFDNLLVVVSNRTVSAALPLGIVQVHRTSLGLPSLTRSNAVNASVAASGVLESSVVVPASTATEPENFLVRAYQDADSGGSRAIYEASFNGGSVVRPSNRIQLTASQQPLAGGLSTLSLIIYNRGFADMDLLLTRNNGADPGDLSISVRNSLGAEVSRLDYVGVPPGTAFTSDGRGYLRIPPAGSRSITVPGVLVPESLGTNSATFVATVDKMYYHLGRPEEDISGSISGSMVSVLAVTPYYGMATTDRALYTDDDAIQITGQAIDRVTGLPKPNAPLRIGFSISGAKFWNNVTSDISGGFSYLYTPPPGMSGTLHIWAAHPDVVDTLNQAEVKLYRCFLSPANVDIRMSKNGTQRFYLTLINTGDELLTGFQMSSQAYQFVGEIKQNTTKIVARSLLETNFVLRPRSTEKVNIELEAALDAPDNAVIEFVLRSSEGASAKFHANLTLLQANPLLVLVDPAVGYVETSVNRGEIRSKTVTLVNRGLRALEGVTMQLPTNNAWMSVNLPAGSNGVVRLPDLPIGSSNSFTVVFAPPASTELDAYEDKLVFRGTNTPAAFEVGLYALVTSEAKGSVRFYVDNILVEPIPNATVRIRNTLIGQDFTAKTDANGFVTVSGLQEGPWAWQVTAAGHSAEVGVIEVIPDQTVLVEPRLSRALVTVNFSVVPVPFTDRYEIVIEQTFETHVPAPVLVLTPPHMDFKNVGYGFEATYIVVAKNFGLIQMTDVTIRGMSDGRGGVLSPLISYIPVLRAQESIEIPMRFTFQAPTPANGQTAGKVARTYNDRRKSLTRDIDADGNITGGVQFPPSFGDNATPAQGFADCATGGLGGLADFVGGLMAIANACATCADLRTAMAVAASAAITYSVLCSPNFSPIPVSPIPCPSGNWVVSFFINLASCACQVLGCFGAGDGGSGDGIGTGLGRGPQSFSQFSPGGAGCFIQGTMVQLEDGSSKRIEDIVPGERVKTGTGRNDYAVVREAQTRNVTDLLGLELGSRTLDATPDHLIWVDGKGWVAARDIRLGDHLTDARGERVRVNAIKPFHGNVTVHTLINSGDHVFYANGLLVHDSCGAPTGVVPVSGIIPPVPRPEDARAKEVAR